MAYITEVHCSSCGKTCMEAVAAGNVAPDTCSICTTEEIASARAVHLAGLKALSVKERLARIEAWIYDYKPQYVPPPRF